MEQEQENKQEHTVEWLDQLENDIIPRVAILIEKEQAHNEFLRTSKVELEFKRGTWCLPWQAETELNIDDITDMINHSNYMLNHFKTRHQEYIDFAKQERSKIK